MTNQVIVLGIDGLDPQKVEKWVPEIKQDVSGTLSLNAFGKPYYTNEIWPSMILGESPRTYGWDPGERDSVSTESSADWETPGLNFLSDIAEQLVPHRFRSRVGNLITETVEDPATTIGADEYPDDHLFTGLKYRAIEIPNWNRGELGLEFTEESWEKILENGELDQFFDMIDEEIETVSGEIHSAAELPYDIIFTHFHYLDSIQHYFDDDVQQEWYENTEELISEFCERYPDRTVVIISDHGLADFEHRPPGFISVSKPWTNDLPESPTEVRLWFEEYFAEEKEQNYARESHLKDLGYID